MLNKRLVKVGFFALALVGVLAFSLAVLTDTSFAQGPGGRGGGRGGQGTVGGCQGSGCQGQAMMGAGQMNAGQMGWGQMSQGQMGQMGAGQGWLCCLPPAVEGDVPAGVIDALAAGLADEHNAYDTYQAVIDQFGAVRPFANIQRAEATHIAALEFLFDRYGLTVPEAAPLAEVPQFSTLAEACAVAAEAEIANFDLYDSWIATVQDYPDMVQVFTALRDASEFQHQPAFENCAAW